MEEIKVGEYIRTKKGYLGKYLKSAEGFDEFIDNEGTFGLDIEEVTKHSPNIIDLIEVGDYVNGEKVINIDRVDSEYGIVKCSNGNHYWNYEIKTIVTKEQFKAIEYKVEVD